MNLNQLKNMGKTDKMIRLLLVAVILVLDLTEVITGTLSWVLSILAVIFAVTALINFCPLYKLVGIRTDKNQTTNG